MRVVIANFGQPIPWSMDFRSFWARHAMPARRPRRSLFEQRLDWGFHIYALGVYLTDLGLADRAEFWTYEEERCTTYHSNGVLRVLFWNEEDVRCYLERYGEPDLFVNYGREGLPILEFLAGRCFRVHVPCLRAGLERQENHGADCYLVDAEQYLDERAQMYVPVVNTRKVRPNGRSADRDFVYLASLYEGKRHDVLLRAVRGTDLTGHLHPVDGSRLDLAGTRITTSGWDERDVAELLTTSRIAVYTGDYTSNPAAMWECVAAGLPIVVNASIQGGKHLVISGVTGELASEDEFAEAMRYVLANRRTYRPREYFEAHWDTIEILERYLAFFTSMGWESGRCS